MKNNEIKSILRNAGGFIAWVVGSGFATGQEILQFFGSYGYRSFAVIAVNLAGFIILGCVQMNRGWQKRELKDFNQYAYYCGKTIGRIYGFVIPATLVLLISVLLSASGATLNQYYGVNRYVGSIIMAGLVLAAYLIGFEKMVRIVSLISPFIILFAVFVGLFTVARDAGNFSAIGSYGAELAAHRAAPGWLMSALLYLSVNFLCGGAYYTELGRTSPSRRSAVWGAVIGSAALILTILLMDLAILLNCGSILDLPVPTLYLARLISDKFGAVFSLVLIMGMFSSCAATVWSFCMAFFRNDPRRNRIFSVVTLIVCLLLGLFPFEKLLSVVYPLIGYAGLFYIGAVAVKAFKK